MGVISPSIPHLSIPLFLETSLGFIPQTKTKITTGEQIHRFQLNVSNQEEETLVLPQHLTKQTCHVHLRGQPFQCHPTQEIRPY